MLKASCLAATFVLLAAACTASTASPDADRAGGAGTLTAGSLTVGAVYPLSGSQGQGGIDEHRGVMLAAELVNQDGGIASRPIRLRSIDVATAEAAPGAIERLETEGIDLVLGSYGSTISAPASETAAANGMLFWETGAVGMLAPASDRGGLTFRVPPTGGVLGASAIAFVDDELAPTFDRAPRTLRYAVSFVDDVYGRSVADGAIGAMRTRDLRDVGHFGYDPRTVDMRELVHAIGAVRPDVLFVSAYLEDAIDLRRELVRQGVPLLANIGTSSSYCMPAFGTTLGEDAVGVYASDKPSATSIDPSGLRPDGASLLARANAADRELWGLDMSPPALAGFSAAWALFAEVMPAADSFAPADVADAALRADLPAGSLPNGSGLLFGAPGTPQAGDNVAAASVIWEWVRPGEAAVIWPEAFATEPVDPTTSDAW
jgi:branched-chain amino acid transport system substrate-binding protein